MSTGAKTPGSDALGADSYGVGTGRKRNWYVLWPLLSCLLPTLVFFLFLLVGLVTGGNGEVGRLEIIASTLGGFVYTAFAAFIIPILCFLPFEIFFRWSEVRVLQGTQSKRRAATKLVLVAFVIGLLAVLPVLTLPINALKILSGPIAFSLVPSIVAVWRINGVKQAEAGAAI